MRILLILAPALVISGCSLLPEGMGGKPKPEAPAAPPPTAAAAILAPNGARTAEQFDTTTAEQRAAATAAPAPAKSSRLGSTVVSLGDPTAPGFWVETPLVTSVQAGRVVHPKSGASVQVELRPSATGGARISLPAMRLLGVPLTELAEVELYSG